MKFEWKEVELSEIADLTVGFVGTMTRHYTDEGVLFLRSTNIEPFNIKMDDIKYISPEFNEQIKKSELKTDDVVIVRTGKPGACTVIPPKDEPWNCSDLVVIHPNKEKVNPYYLAAYINLASGVINANLVGAVQQHFNVGSAKKMKIQLPSLQIQNRIASIIQGLNKKIALNNKINDNLEQQAEALFKAWFFDYLAFGGEIPQEWTNSTIEELTSLVSRGIAPKYTEDSDQVVINQKCIRDHRIDLSLARTHTPKKMNEKWLQFGDLLINSTGEGTLGRTAQVWFNPEKMTVDSHVTIVRPKSKELIYYIGFWGLLHEREIESLHTGSTGQTELPRERIKAMELVVPDQETLAKFNAIVQPMTGTIINNQIQNNKLAALRDALLPKLMAGEIDIWNH